MDRERDRLIELFYENNVRCDQTIEELVDDVYDIVDQGVTVQRWIPVTERLPEDDKEVRFYNDGHLTMVTVLVYDEYSGIKTANRLNVPPCGNPYLDQNATNGWEWSNNCKLVTHWMPLPEPPKEEE